MLMSKFNPIHATDLFWYSLKTSENQRFSDVFREYQKRSVAWNELNRIRATKKSLKKVKNGQNSYITPEAVVLRSSVKKVLIEISQNSQENTWGLKPATLLKKKLWHKWILRNF